MRALIKGGLLLALGWLANRADGQELHQWSAVTNVPLHASANTGASGGRPVGLGQPVRLPGDPGAAPTAFQPIVRGQAGDEITVQPLPKVDKTPKDEKPLRVIPLNEGFVPPRPAPIIPSPVFDSMGGMGDCCGLDSACGPRLGRKGFLADTGCCPERGRCWMSAEYLLWWQRAQSVPPLVAVNNLGNNPIIGQPGTTVLYDQTPNRTRGGARFALGRWLPHFCDNVGIETNFFFLGRQDATASFGTNGTSVFGRPFDDATAGTRAAEVFANNRDRTGSVVINNYSQLWGMEMNLRRKWRCGPTWWVDALVGYRHLNMSEGIDITENLLLTQAPNIGTQITEQESFHTRNLFNGGQFGLDGEWRCWNRCVVGMTAKVAFGCVHQIVYIDGTTTTFIPPGPATTQTGALLATQTNIGRRTQNRFGVLPEFAVKLGYDVTDNLRLSVGYDFIYLSSVVRPGEQIDLTVNQNFRPTGNANLGGPRVPAVLFRTNDYWAQGLTFAATYRW